ncbi:hypothetical protein HPC49_34245 [Pyxidicoccus fallax]|uniref:Beta-ketoacyl synthase N-terminal domain-containing protein n=1 Tax=Pyxidicoccus fallax TaxID=394095 RepID=A0A848LKY7_9BACT|nr:hypothetical protein [Pyxidicoccus fallax]NMO18352.1 hypothetical protein [Pyxidicoccus fallax]NPC83269.1 hypothetical protein [Pyxidicoccus fallax]
MVSSLGWNAASSCAAIRAGVSRPRPLTYFQVLEDGELQTTPLMGHPVHGFTEGFGPPGRWLRLAQGCMLDLLEGLKTQQREDPSFWRSTGLICITPVLAPERFIEAQQPGPEALKSTLHDRLLHLLDLPWTPRAHFVSTGHAGVHDALALATRLLDTQGLARCVVLAADSYLDQLSLEWLASAGRLKTPDVPCGLMPGEAGACLMVEPLSAARRQGSPIHAVIESSVTSQEPDRFFTEEVHTGARLSDMIRGALANVAASGSFEGDIVIDLNGEDWRAQDWGCSRVRLSETLGARCRLVIPGSSLGDVGAASGVVAMCVAARSFARGYAATRRTLVVSSSEYGHAGASLLSASERAR